MAKKPHDTPNLDALESGPWPSFVSASSVWQRQGRRGRPPRPSGAFLRDEKRLLERRNARRIRLRRRHHTALHRDQGRERKPTFPDAAEFHTLASCRRRHALQHRDPAQACRHLGKHGSGLIAFHGQSGDIMFQARPARMCRRPSTRSTRPVSTWAAPARIAHLHVLRRCGALRAVLLRRGRRTGW